LSINTLQSNLHLRSIKRTHFEMMPRSISLLLPILRLHHLWVLRDSGLALAAPAHSFLR
jgi:hypothetical protein